MSRVLPSPRAREAHVSNVSTLQPSGPEPARARRSAASGAGSHETHAAQVAAILPGRTCEIFTHFRWPGRTGRPPASKALASRHLLGHPVAVQQPEANLEGLYDPRNERDSCGMGFVAHVRGLRSNAIIAQGLKILANLDHR